MKDIKDVDVFASSNLQDKAATLYHDKKTGLSHMYVGAEKYRVDDMAVLLEGDLPLVEKLQAFKFTTDVKLEGVIAIIQLDEYYVVTLVVPMFSNVNGAVPNDVIVFKVGNALNDVA